MKHTLVPGLMPSFDEAELERQSDLVLLHRQNPYLLRAEKRFR